MTPDWIERLNELGQRRVPAFLLLSFTSEVANLWTAAEYAQDPDLAFTFPGATNRPVSPNSGRHDPGDLLCGARFPESATYRRAFEIVQAGLQRGNSFLTNLTWPTPVELSATPEEIYHYAAAPYRIWWRGRFVCFSPETFVRIDPAGVISSNPMKGTAEDTPTGRKTLLTSPKEIAEHATIVDLIRNDLSQVAKRVRVDRYRYLDRIETPRGGLLQTSSRISGQLPSDWRARLGDIVRQLLPAGSVSGAPKPATLALIRRAEQRDRGFYCGIGLYFDGQRVDSCVLIRFIQQKEDGTHLFWAGGGITARSHWADEYAELRAKVRIPLSKVNNN